MSKKIVELQRLDSFLRSTDREHFPAPEVSESPDFLFRFERYTLGVEVTRMVSPRVPGGDNPRQSSSVLDSLLRAIEDHYDGLAGPPAHVSVFFRRGLRVPKNSLDQLAQVLAAEFLAGIERALVRNPNRRPLEIVIRHSAVASIGVWLCQGDEVPRWRFHRGGAVDSARDEDVIATLAPKEAKVSRYRERAQKVWLLIVCDLFADGLFIDPPEDPIPFRVSSGFDRVFLLEWTGSRVVEVPVAGNHLG